MQMRPLIFSTYSTIIFIVYWLYDKVVVYPDQSVWIDDWFECLVVGGGQKACSEISVPNIPVIGGYAFVFVSLHTHHTSVSCKLC